MKNTVVKVLVIASVLSPVPAFAQDTDDRYLHHEKGHR
jgi:hypothetical protein